MRTNSRGSRGALFWGMTAAISAGLLSACGGEPQAGDLEEDEAALSGINPADFTTHIDHPFFTLKPWTSFKYRVTKDSGEDQSLFEVTHDTKTIVGVKCVIVHDRSFLKGQVVENTFDYFAQDKAGNVRYFGEDTAELENGKVVSTEGTWRAGRNGARTGIIMEAHPQVGDVYREEFSKGVAEDQAQVLGLDESVTVPEGTFHHCLKTKNFTRMDPVVEEKTYCQDGVRQVVRTVGVKGGKSLEVLVDVVD